MIKQCEYCERAMPLVTDKCGDKGISLIYPNTLSAYGYDIHGTNSNGICVKVNFCPMCGRYLRGEAQPCEDTWSIIDVADALEKHGIISKEGTKMELREEEKGYLENDKESVLETAQNLIADESFQYGGDSLTVLEIINAIKDGYRLANLAEVDRRIGDAFNKGFEEGLRAAKGE